MTLEEPGDHGIGRSRGGLTTKIHALVDGRGRPLVLAISPGRAGDTAMLPVLPRPAAGRPGRAGRPRTRPDGVAGDKAYSARAHRVLLRSRGVRAVIGEPSDQIGHRRRRGSRGGRPPAFDRVAYRGRNVIERFLGLPTVWLTRALGGGQAA